jgi:hypothetical protein
MSFDAAAADYQRVILALLLSVPIPLVLAKMLGSGSLFGRVQSLIVRFAGVRTPPAGAAALDSALRASLQRSHGLVAAGALQLAALVSGVASLVSWQWMEGRRLRAPAHNQS